MNVFEPKPRTKRSDFKAVLPIKLADAYNGRTKRMRVKFQEDCTVCCKKCPFCNGEGTFVDIENVPGKKTCIARQKDCKSCNGTGVQERACPNCNVCRGKGKFAKTQILDIVIEPGMANLQTIVMEMETMNAAITLKIQKHRTFHRVNNDLFLTKKISLKESLFGTSFGVKTLDDRQLTLESPKFKSIDKIQAYRVRREGMPIFREHSRRGDMYIKFVVEFPKQLGAEDAMLVERLNGLVKIRAGLTALNLKKNPSKMSTEHSGPGDSSEGTIPFMPLKPELVSLGDQKKPESFSSTNSEPLVVLNSQIH